MQTHYLNNIIHIFHQYKELGEKAIAQIGDEQINYTYRDNSNSVSIIVKHLHGNMMSRWSDFLSSDGEKSWRNRDEEFEGAYRDKAELLQAWNTGWQCLFHALDTLYEEDLKRVVYIRSQPLSVMEAINRQLAHYSYHLGQIVFLCKLLSEESFESLSIPKGKSQLFNKEMEHKPK